MGVAAVSPGLVMGLVDDESAAVLLPMGAGAQVVGRF